MCCGLGEEERTKIRKKKKEKLDRSLPANPVNDWCKANAVRDAQKYFLSTVKSASIHKYLIMELPEK